MVPKVSLELPRKRLLIVAPTCVDADQRSEYLRLRGYQVDCAPNAAVALSLSYQHSYDIVVLAIDSDHLGIAQLADQLQKLNPNSTVTCLADCKKPIPPLPCDRMLWKGEPLEYFVARVEALAAA